MSQSASRNYSNASQSIIKGVPSSGPFIKSRNGKFPRSINRAIAESNDVNLRSRMQEARVELANEFLSDETNSLSKVRLLRGFSQQQLARIIGTSQPHIANLEAGKLEPKFSTVTKIADALGLSLDEIRPMIETKNIKNHESF